MSMATHLTKLLSYIITNISDPGVGTTGTGSGGNVIQSKTKEYDTDIYYKLTC